VGKLQYPIVVGMLLFTHYLQEKLSSFCEDSLEHDDHSKDPTSAVEEAALPPTVVSIDPPMVQSPSFHFANDAPPLPDIVEWPVAADLSPVEEKSVDRVATCTTVQRQQSVSSIDETPVFSSADDTEFTRPPQEVEVVNMVTQTMKSHEPGLVVESLSLVSSPEELATGELPAPDLANVEVVSICSPTAQNEIVSLVSTTQELPSDDQPAPKTPTVEVEPPYLPTAKMETVLLASASRELDSQEQCGQDTATVDVEPSSLTTAKTETVSLVSESEELELHDLHEPETASVQLEPSSLSNANVETMSLVSGAEELDYEEHPAPETPTVDVEPSFLPTASTETVSLVSKAEELDIDEQPSGDAATVTMEPPTCLSSNQEDAACDSTAAMPQLTSSLEQLTETVSWELQQQMALASLQETPTFLGAEDAELELVEGAPSEVAELHLESQKPFAGLEETHAFLSAEDANVESVVGEEQLKVATRKLTRQEPVPTVTEVSPCMSTDDAYLPFDAEEEREVATCRVKRLQPVPAVQEVLSLSMTSDVDLLEEDQQQLAEVALCTAPEEVCTLEVSRKELTRNMNKV
jgi:hypothetical protein